MAAGPVEAVERSLEALGDDPWHAFLHVDAEGARKRALALQSEGARGRALWGLVASVKDNLAWAGRPMTCGSRHLEHYHSPYSASAVERLEAAGAIILGKTNLDEFGAGSSGENSAFGPTLNPRDLTRVPGGSSSGAGASVAAGVVDLALGSDTGGSARCPGAFCGVSAFKPTYGLVSRHGLADLAMSLESPAPLARDVDTLARSLAAIAGADLRDTATGAQTLGAVPEMDAADLRIGVPREYFEGLAPDVETPVRATLKRLEQRGAHLVDVSIPSVHDALAAYYVTNYAEFSSAMARYDGFRYGTPGTGKSAREAQSAARATFGAEVKRRILLGTFVTSREEQGAWVDAAARMRAQVAREFDTALSQTDVLMSPTMPTRAFALGERVEDPRAMYAADILTVSANLAGIPAGSVPLRVEGLPVGLQVLGRSGEDARVLAAMRLVEALA